MAPGSAWLGPRLLRRGGGISRLGKSLRSHSELNDRATRGLSRGAARDGEPLERATPEHGFLLESPDEHGNEIRLQRPAAHGQLSAPFSQLYAGEPEPLHGLSRKGAEVFRVSARAGRTALSELAHERASQGDRGFDALQVLIELRFAFFRAELRGDFSELLLLLFVGVPQFLHRALVLPS